MYYARLYTRALRIYYTLFEYGDFPFELGKMILSVYGLIFVVYYISTELPQERLHPYVSAAMRYRVGCSGISSSACRVRLHITLYRNILTPFLKVRVGAHLQHTKQILVHTVTYSALHIGTPVSI